MERHLGGDVLHVELANQVSFLNRAALDRLFNSIPRGGHLLLDAQNTVYIDPDILSMVREYKEDTAPVRGVKVSLVGFQNKYQLKDEIQYVDYSTRDLQELLTPAQVLQILKEGNERFRTGKRLTRDLGRQMKATAAGQHPLAVVLSCIDSRTPAELILDLGLGDIFSIRIAGNIISAKVLGSMEFGCAVAGAKLIVIMGHTQCGAVTAAVKFNESQQSVEQATGCQHLQAVVNEIRKAIDPQEFQNLNQRAEPERVAFVNDVARRNVQKTIATHPAGKSDHSSIGG